MALCAFLGDEVTGLGFRLAGVDCYRPAAEDVPALLRELAPEVELILVAAELAATLPPDLIRGWQSTLRPLFLVVPDSRGRVACPDRASTVRRTLGMSE
jgi:vacuolar-type H+-ATPase subunit F/Vma7